MNRSDGVFKGVFMDDLINGGKCIRRVHVGYHAWCHLVSYAQPGKANSFAFSFAFSYAHSGKANSFAFLFAFSYAHSGKA